MIDPAQYYMQQQQRQDDQLRNLLNMFMMMKQYKSEQSWKQKNYELDKQRTEAYEKSAQAREMTAERPTQKPEWFLKAEIIAAQTGKPIGQVVNEMQFPPKEPKQTLEEKTKEWKAKAAAQAPYKNKGVPPAEKRDTQYQKDKGNIDRYYSREAARVNADFKKQLASALADAYVKPEQKVTAQTAIEGQLKSALADLDAQRVKELATLDTNYADLPRFKVKKSAAPKQTATVNGKEYPLNDDGTVTINGKRYAIRPKG